MLMLKDRVENKNNNNFNSNFEEGKSDKNKFGESKNNERKRIGSEKECWERERGAFPVGVSGQAGK